MSATEDTAEPITTRLDEAFAYASELHRARRRRDGRTPYIAHLMGVTAIVLADGGSEDAAIAALFHDAVCHPDDIPVLNEIRRRFGANVAALVEGCADHDPAQDRPSWEVRKAAHVARLKDADEAVLRILLADSLYNGRELVLDYATVGELVWARYSAGRRIVDHLRALSEVFTARLPGPLAEELDRTVAALEHRTTPVPA